MAFAMAPFDAGLTNQKFALLGLALRARDEGRAIALPDLVDFTPGGPNPRIPLDTVLDRAALVDGLAAFGVRVVEAGEPLPPDSLFVAAATALADLRRADAMAEFAALCRLLAAMRAAPPIAAMVPALDAVHLQLRVERDWLAYTRGPLAAQFPDEALYLDPAAILAKLTATFGPGLTLYATCNRADLPVPPAAIATEAAAHGHRLLFRADIAPILPLGPLADAAFDFALAASLPRRVGHSRSTFFSALSLARFGATGEADDAWLYNVRGERLKPRTDHGAFVRPWPATALR